MTKQSQKSPWYQAELTVRLCPPVVREHYDKKIDNPESVLDLCGSLAEADQETGVIITVDAKNQLINRHVVTIGLLDSCLIHPREFYRRAILDNAARYIFLHNHPSGDTRPSAEDVRVTRQLVDAGRVLGIELLDSVVIGRDNTGKPTMLSMRTSGIVQFGV
jgi:DNA repair protein RadC